MNLTNRDLPYVSYLDDSTRQLIIDLVSGEPGIDELWNKYGESIGLAATGESPIEAAKRNFNRRLGEIKMIICNDKIIKSFISDPGTTTLVDLALIFTGKLVSEKFGGIDVCAVGVLVARLGLLTLCSATQIE